MPKQHELILLIKYELNKARTNYLSYACAYVCTRIATIKQNMSYIIISEHVCIIFKFYLCCSRNIYMVTSLPCPCKELHKGNQQAQLTDTKYPCEMALPLCLKQQIKLDSRAWQKKIIHPMYNNQLNNTALTSITCEPI